MNNKRMQSAPKSFNRTLRRIAYRGVLGILAVTAGCTNTVNAQDISMPQCRQNTPFSKSSDTHVRSVHELTQNTELDLVTLRDQALQAPSRSLNIVAAVGLVTLRQSDIPEIEIKGLRDVALTLPSGESRVTIVFPTNVHGQFNIDPEVFGCKEKDGTAFYHNQLPNIIHSYAAGLATA